MGHPAGIAQLVEHDLAKVGVEGPSPFSRSKKRESTTLWCFSFFYNVRWVGPSKRVRHYLARGRSLWRQIMSLRRSREPFRVSEQPCEAGGLRTNIPFSRSKAKEPLNEWFFLFYRKNGVGRETLWGRCVRLNWLHARSAKKTIQNLERQRKGPQGEQAAERSSGTAQRVIPFPAKRRLRSVEAKVWFCSNSLFARQSFRRKFLALPNLDIFVRLGNMNTKNLIGRNATKIYDKKNYMASKLAYSLPRKCQ